MNSAVAAEKAAEADPGSGGSGAPPSPQEINAVYVGLMIVLGLAAVDQSIVATALPRIVDDLGGVTHLSWVVTAYVLTSTATMPLYGKLSDQYGRKPMLYVSILAFLFGSVLSGAAQTITQLVIFRAIQGIGAGGLLPLAQIVIGDLVPPLERGRRQGSISAMFAVCSVLGPVLGGLITDLLSWHWIFYVNLPIGAVALAVIAKSLRRRRQFKKRRIDYLGAFLLTVGTTALLLVLALGGNEWPWRSPQIAICSVAFLILFVAFIAHLRKAPEPVLPLDLFRNRVFVVASAVMALTFMGMLGATLFFPLFFQMVIGISAANSGFLTGPMMVGLVISSIANGRALQRSGRYKNAQILGLGFASSSFAILAWSVAASGSLYIVEPAIFALGLGLGFVMPNMTMAVQNALPPADRGVGTAALSFFRSLGGLIGVTAAGAILARELRASGQSSLGEIGAQQLASLSPQAHIAALGVYRHAIATTFVAGGVIIVLALIILLFLPELPLLDRTTESDDQRSKYSAASS